MTERNLNIKDEEMTEELTVLLNFMEKRLLSELPTTVLNWDYFIFGALNQRNNWLCDFLESNMTSMAINNIHDAYYKYLSSGALSAVKPDRKIVYDEKFNEVLESAKEEAKNFVIDGRVSTLHIFLAILKDNSSTNKIKLIFSKAGMTYDIALAKAKEFKSFTDVSITEEQEDETPIKAKVINLGNISGVDSSEIAKRITNAISGNMNQDGQIPQMPGMSKKLKGKNANIKAYCTNLNTLVENGKIEGIVGRERETNEIIRILGRKKKNNAILLGGEGVGKTAIAENIAYKIVNGTVPHFLINKTILSLDMTALMAGTTLRGMFEERVKGILDEIREDGNFILFIDNIGAVLADKGKNDYEISSMLSRSLENGECQVIGTSDFSSYRKTFDKDPSLARRFQKILVDAPSKEESLNILRSIKTSYEKFHDVKYSEEAVDACVELASKYITERNLPDSAIDIMDEAGSLIGTVFDDSRLSDSLAEIKALKQQIKDAENDDNYEESDKLKEVLEEKNRNYNTLISDIKEERKNNPKSIELSNILDIVSNKTGIPVNQLTDDDKKILVGINDRLKSEVIGQDAAIDTICRALKRNRIGLHKHGCMYSFMAIGKTGTGKTLVAKKLAKEMFGTEKALVRFDMSEYPDKTAVDKLIGSNPGYVGYEDGGLLTEAIKNKKYCILLLDEIEKADKEVYNIFLQVLDEGFLTDNTGQKIDFSNVIIIFTSNAGAREANEFGNGIGFDDDKNENTKRILNKELKRRFPPEFLNRVDNVIYFNSLTDDNMKEIIKIEISKLAENVKELGFSMSYEDNVVDKILSLIDKERDFGARPIMRAIQDNIEDKITDFILEKSPKQGHEFKIKCNKDNHIIVK